MHVRLDKRSATLEVADQGSGIDPEVVPRLFDRFYRADESRAGMRGAGLGLSIAKEIADAHGTAIVVSATPGGGATFGIELPLADEPVPSDPR
jgi:signal transduction histidine kinase